MIACAGLALTALILAGVASGWIAVVRARGRSTRPSRSPASCARSSAPVYNALFARVLPREQFARGAGMGSVVFQTGLVLGPAIGGVLVGLGRQDRGLRGGGGVRDRGGDRDRSLRVTEPPSPAERAPIFASIGEGLRFVFGNQIVLGALALDMFSVLFGGAVALLPAFINDILHYGPGGARHPARRAGRGRGAGRPVAGAAAAADAMRGACCCSRWRLRRCASSASRCRTHFWLSVVMLLLSGMCDGVSVVLRSTILQLATPDDMRGRVSSINGIFIGSSNELGAFESGLAAQAAGAGAER